MNVPRLASILAVMLSGFGTLQGPAHPGSGPAREDSSATATPVVEYVKIEGQLCLQPRVVTGLPEDSDFIAAQKRWLTKNYPGYRLVRQQHLLTLAPEYRPPGHEDDPPTTQDSIELETVDGKPVSVCFSLVLPATLGGNE